MNKDLKIIKKHYGEKMMHLCRELFPTLLEQEGLLSKLILDNFAPSKFLYDDIIESKNVNSFKAYIYNLIEYESSINESYKTPKELLSEAGYELYECKTEKAIQKFKKYYVPEEELCTFKGNRLDRCHVFFAVKKNANEIKRENFSYPKREDEYGTSVISIQFTKGKTNTLSIKNRYNHTVENPDATFSNNLENIIEGLTNSFEKEYNLNINQNEYKNFDLPDYVKANDGKFYKYNYEIDNVYYCPNNIIIDNFEVKEYPKEKYIILDYFIIDLVNKKIELYEETIPDCFVKLIANITKIDIINSKETGGKYIELITKEVNKITIELDKTNKIIGYKNNNLTKIENNFLSYNENLKYIELLNVKEIGDNFLEYNKDLISLDVPNVEKIETYFLYLNDKLENINLPKVKKIGADFLSSNCKLKSFEALELEEVESGFCSDNIEMNYINVPKIKKIGSGFLYSNENIVCFEAPELVEIGHQFLKHNMIIKRIKLPKLEVVGGSFLESNNELIELELPNVIYIGSNFLKYNEILQRLILPKVKEIRDDFLSQNAHLKILLIPLLEKVGNGFLYKNKSLKYLEAPMLREIGKYFINYEGKLSALYAPNLGDLEKWFLNKRLRVVDDINQLYNTPIKKIEKRLLDISYKISNQEKNKCLVKEK